MEDFKSEFEQKSKEIHGMLGNALDMIGEEFDKETKQLIIDSTKDLVMDLMYYGRKDDEDLTIKRIDDAVNKGVITSDEIVEAFRIELEEHFK
jgi:hypothetical protein